MSDTKQNKESSGLNAKAAAFVPRSHTSTSSVITGHSHSARPFNPSPSPYKNQPFHPSHSHHNYNYNANQHHISHHNQHHSHNTNYNSYNSNFNPPSNYNNPSYTYYHNSKNHNNIDNSRSNFKNKSVPEFFPSNFKTENEVKSTFKSEIKTTPESEVKPIPGSEVKTTPEPEIKVTPEPEVKATPEPESEIKEENTKSQPELVSEEQDIENNKEESVQPDLDSILKDLGDEDDEDDEDNEDDEDDEDAEISIVCGDVGIFNLEKMYELQDMLNYCYKQFPQLKEDLIPSSIRTQSKLIPSQVSTIGGTTLPNNDKGKGDKRGNFGTSSGSKKKYKRDHPVRRLERGENAYVVRKDRSDDEKKLRSVRLILNKLSLDNLPKLVETVKSLQIDNEQLMMDVVSCIFEKSLSEPHFAPVYAKFCSELKTIKFLKTAPPAPLNYSDIAKSSSTPSTEPDTKTFRYLILKSCQDAFDGFNYELINDVSVDSTEEQLQIINKERKRMFGGMRFFGELYLLNMIKDDIVKHCIVTVLSVAVNGVEDAIEALCKFVTTVGKALDASQRDVLDSQMTTFRSIVNDKQKFNSRMRFLMLDVIELREKYNWIPRIPGQAPAPALAVPTPRPAASLSSSKPKFDDKKPKPKTQSTFAERRDNREETNDREPRNRPVKDAPVEKSDAWVTVSKNEPVKRNEKKNDKKNDRKGSNRVQEKGNQNKNMKTNQRNTQHSAPSPVPTPSPVVSQPKPKTKSVTNTGLFGALMDDDDEEEDDNEENVEEDDVKQEDEDTKFMCSDFVSRYIDHSTHNSVKSAITEYMSEKSMDDVEYYIGKCEADSHFLFVSTGFFHILEAFFRDVNSSLNHLTLISQLLDEKSIKLGLLAIIRTCDDYDIPSSINSFGYYVNSLLEKKLVDFSFISSDPFITDLSDQGDKKMIAFFRDIVPNLSDEQKEVLTGVVSDKVRASLEI